MRCVIFDLDGTLADTGTDMIAATNVALARMGVAASLRPGADAATAFRGGRAMLRLAAARAGITGAEADGMVDAGYPLMLEAYGAALDVHTVLYPGVVAAINRLIARDIRVGICTNKPAALAVDLIARLGLDGQFPVLVGADTLPVRKPDPAPYRAAVAQVGGRLDRSMLIGDTATDRDTARAAGVPCALVTFGPAGMDVARLEPDALLPDYAALDAVVDRLI